MTGAIEPYCYQRLRDGLFQRTMFIAPNTAAIISSSVQQDTGGMLNLFLTDKAAISALVTEYERYFVLCRPLMRVFTGRDTEGFYQAIAGLGAAEGAAYLNCAMPPLFAMPEALAREITAQTGSKTLRPLWKKSVSMFRKNIAKQQLTVSVLDPKLALLTPQALTLPMAELMETGSFTYTQEQYLTHYERLTKLTDRYENVRVSIRDDIASNMLLYAKEDTGVVMAKADTPMSAFVIQERNMINAVWDYMKGSGEAHSIK